MSSTGLAKVVNEVAEKIIENLESSFQELSIEIKKIIEREREETSRVVDEIVEQAERRSEMIKSRTLSLTQVRIRGRKLEELEKCVEEVISRVLEVVKEKSSRHELDVYLEKMLEEAVDIVGVGKVKAYTNPSLLESLRIASMNISRKKNVEITVMDDPVDTVFGVVVRSYDDSVSYDNRIETKLERLKPYIRRSVASLLS